MASLTKPEIVSAGKWRHERDELLKAEKEATRALDALAARRRRLPMVKFGNTYLFGSPHGPSLSPETCYERRESVELAFIVALQLLPPLQRAVLLLREVAGLSAAEMANQLGTSASAVNSALQRARAAVRSRVPARSQQTALRVLGDQRVRQLAGRYAAAFEQADIDSLVGMLTEDATWSMPPVPAWFRGRGAIREFLSGGPLAERWKHRPARANGQLAVGCYVFSQPENSFVAAVIDVLTLDGEKVAAVTAFPAAEAVPPPHSRGQVTGAELFGRFGLPARLP